MKASSAIVTSFLMLSISLPVCGGQMSQQGKDDHQGHEMHRKMAESASPDDSMNVKIHLRDLELLTADGERVRFKSDVIGDKIVAITFIYTTCTTICPIFNALFSQAQNLLGDRLGEGISLISMSLDPARDVPLRMKKEARKFKAKPGWIFLTGEKENLDQVLRGLDAYFADFTLHPPMVIIGDGKTGQWKRINGFPEPKRIVALIDEFKAARDGISRKAAKPAK